jgi:hypothetical protein
MAGEVSSTNSSLFTDMAKKGELLEKIGNYTNLAGDFTNIVGAYINYNALKGDLRNYNLSADSIELQAKQKANQIRQQYLQTAANYSYNAARRGISVNSASVRSNLEGSAEAMGKDIQRLEQNAYLEANALRAQAKIYKAYGKAERNKAVTESAVNIFGTAMSMGGSSTGGGA